MSWSLVSVAVTPSADESYSISASQLEPLASHVTLDPSVVVLPGLQAWRTPGGKEEFAFELASAHNFVGMPVEWSHNSGGCVRPGALQVGGVYVIRGTVADAVDPALTSYADIRIDVVSGGVLASIAFGDRHVDSSSPLQLDGSNSVDLDNVPASVDPEPMVYQWQCVAWRLGSDTAGNNSESCATSNGSLLVLPNTAIISIAANSLLPAVYVVSLTVSRGRVGGRIPFHYRSANASVTIIVSDSDLPSVHVNCSSLATTVAVGAHVTLTGSFELRTHVLSRAQWTFPDMSDSDVAAAVRSTVFTSPVLAVQMNVLPGTYAFVLTAQTTDGLSVSGSVTLTVNAAPRLGYVSGMPQTGTALETAFTISAGGWVSTPEVSEDHPIRIPGCVHRLPSTLGAVMMCFWVGSRHRSRTGLRTSLAA